MEGISCTAGAAVAAAAAAAAAGPFFSAAALLLAARRGSAPSHCPPRTPRSSSVLVSWQSAHGEHQSQTQKSEIAEPRIEKRSRICMRRHAPSPTAAAPATAEMIVRTCHATLYWCAQNWTLAAKVSAWAVPPLASSALSAASVCEARQRSLLT